ncbi:MAG TPA: hypothetical protein VFB80_03575, partial [Pirellulaceae bacterium]|nr:hypothetical protein [Pirellulaceae bacterium]
MTASTRILLCRIGCVALCLVPTALVAGWTCWRASASFAVAQRADWERELTSRFGLVAEIGGVSYPSPGLARLDNFRLLDPESRQLVLSAAIVEVAAHEGGWQVELWQSQVQASGLGSLARAIEDRILRSPESLARCEISARELSIVRGSAAQSLVQIAAQLSPRPEGSLLTCEFHLPA